MVKRRKMVEFLVTEDEMRIIKEKRRIRIKKNMKKRLAMRRRQRFVRKIRRRMEPFWQRIGGTVLILISMLVVAIENNQPDNGEVIFSAAVVAILGIVLLLVKDNVIED